MHSISWSDGLNISYIDSLQFNRYRSLQICMATDAKKKNTHTQQKQANSYRMAFRSAIHDVVAVTHKTKLL